AEVGELNNFVSLVMMPKYDQPLAHCLFDRPYALVAFGGIHPEVVAWDLRLAEWARPVSPQRGVCANRLLGHATGRVQLRFDEPRRQRFAEWNRLSGGKFNRGA